MDPRFAAAKRFAEEEEEEQPHVEDEGGPASDAEGLEEDEDDGEDGEEEQPENKKGMSELSAKKLERIKNSIEKTGERRQLGFDL